MKVVNNRNLFYVLAGLVSSGANAYDHNDLEVSALAEQIVGLDISGNVKTWFSRAKTGQIEVNPYWPRGSAIATACFFVKDGVFDIDACFDFFESTGAMIDPIGVDDLRAWIIYLPEILAYFEALPSIQVLWDEYCRIVNFRMLEWNKIIDEATITAEMFFGENAPKMNFTPNLFSAYSTDFVRIGNQITVIAPGPDVESMLHETLHTVVAVYREKIMGFSVKNGLVGFANRDKMMEYGYMADDSADSITHVIEECFVRAISVVLAKKSDERLQFHAKYGCDSVPFIASHFKSIRPTINDMGTFIDTVLLAVLKLPRVPEKKIAIRRAL